MSKKKKQKPTLAERYVTTRKAMYREQDPEKRAKLEKELKQIMNKIQSHEQN